MRFLALTAFAAVLASSPAHAADDPWHDKARTMLEHAVNIPTVIGRTKVPELANYFADQFRQAGWPEADIHVMPYDTIGDPGQPSDHTAALIVRWRADGHPKQKPIMLMGHMDVVEAKREDWAATHPFIFTEKDGYYYGRGTIDMKDGDVAIITSLLKLKAEGFKPKRDIIVFFTGDEETNGAGAHMGATTWHGLIDVEYGLNADSGGGALRPDGSVIGFAFNTAEKTFANYEFTVRNKGGHSSKPRPDNAIYQLAGALQRLEAYRFEPMLNETTRGYFTERQKSEKGALGDAMRAWLKDEEDGKAADFIEADATEVGLTRTRCVATLLKAGHAQNALPQLATANINCRIMPGIDPNSIRGLLEKIANEGVGPDPVDHGPLIKVTRLDNWKASLASPIRPDVLKAYSDAVHVRWPGAAIVPEMSTGASDARDFREVGIQVYGTGGAWVVAPIDFRAHGRDERLPVKALDDNINHMKFMVKAFTSK